MSHVVMTESDKESQRFSDLDVLSRAAERCNADLRIGQRHFRYYGSSTSVCEHALISRDTDKSGRRLEIGLVRSEKYADSFSLAYDPDSFYSKTGFGTGKHNQPFDKLQMFYELENARKTAMTKNYSFEEKLETDGSITVRCSDMMAAV